MDSFEINKIIAAVLMVALLVIGIGKLSDIIFHVEKPKSPGSVVKVEEAVTASSQLSSETVEEKIDMVAFMALGDLATGEKVFKKCAKALSGYGKEWTFEELNGYLIKPAKWIKGTKMAFAGLRKETDRASVIKYLNQNSDNPLPLP